MARVAIMVVVAVAACMYSQLHALRSDSAARPPGETPSHTGVDLLVVLAPAPAHQITRIAGGIAARHALALKDTWPIASLQRNCYVFRAPGGPGLERRLVRLRTDPRVESVQEMQLYSVAGVKAVDPYINLQHSLVSARIDEAHGLSTGKDVKIAIIDTGIDRSHYDLRRRVVAALNFVDADQTIEIVEFHATAVAGIIGAEAHNERGIVGIAPDSRMYSLRACSESIPGTSRGQCNSAALVRALDWAILNDMKVVNMSLQGRYDPLVSRLITRAVDEGLVVVAATELDDGQLAFPASMGEVIAVSYQDTHRATDYTRNAGKVFIAPAEEILTTMPDNTYDFVTGSSFASAHVSGIVALLAEHVPAIDAHTVKAVLRSSTRVANWTVLIDSCTALATVTGLDNCRPLPE